MRVNRRLYSILQELYLRRKYHNLSNNCIYNNNFIRRDDTFTFEKLKQYPAHSRFLNCISISTVVHHSVDPVLIRKALKNVKTLREIHIHLWSEGEVQQLLPLGIRIESAHITIQKTRQHDVAEIDYLRTICINEDLKFLSLGEPLSLNLYQDSPVSYFYLFRSYSFHKNDTPKNSNNCTFARQFVY